LFGAFFRLHLHPITNGVIVTNPPHKIHVNVTQSTSACHVASLIVAVESDCGGGIVPLPCRIQPPGNRLDRSGDIMTISSTLRSVLLVGVAGATLSACGAGADDVASPGEGNIVILPVPAPAPAPAPAPSPSPTPTPTPGAAAPSCPQGTIDSGTIQVSATDTRRNCQVSGTITGACRLR